MAAFNMELVAGRPRIAVNRAGAGELIVLLHGIGGNRSNWDDQMPPFSEQFHAIAWDARGYGASDDYDGSLNFADFADDLLRVIDHYAASRAHLVGLSMGGVIALDFIDRFTERVATLVLCDSLPGFSQLSDEQRREFIRLRQEPLLAGKEPKDIAPVVAKTLLSSNPRPGCFERLVASMASLHKDSYLKTIAGMANYDRRFNLEAIRVPTLIVVGDEDRLTPPATSRAMAARIENAELIIIEHAGHLTNIEQPETFNRVVLGFLSKHRMGAEARAEQ